MKARIRAKSAPTPLIEPVNKTDSTYRKTVLEKGVRVVTEEIPHVRSVSVGLWIDNGSRDETERLNGISHFIEHMVFKGTKKRSVAEISRSLESVGGYLNAFTGKEHTCFYARVLDEYTELAIDVLTDLVENPTFPPKELEKEKGVVIEELRNAEDDPDEIIHDYLEKILYGEHPLGFPIIGTEHTVRSFSRDDLIGFHDRNYRYSRMVFAASGRLNHDHIVELVDRYLAQRGGANGGQRPLRDRPRQQKPTKAVYDKPIQQAHLCMGTVAFSIRSKHRYPLLVLNTLLGDGMSSRLFQSLREKRGLAYSVYSFTNLLNDTGSFGVYVGTDNQNIEPSIELIWKELERLRTKEVSNAELKRTQAQLKGSMMLSLENIPNRMMRLGSSELYFNELKSLDWIIHQIEAVNQEAIYEVANQLFHSENFATVIFRANGHGRGKGISVS
ncbi:MAG TPA: pitrilysin family protein [Bacteroidota bacterium]|nr:pitrilysin family protein [Bacteroidota bacterium]